MSEFDPGPAEATTGVEAEVTEVRGPRYMARFRCIGPDCEDHCCGPWEVSLGADDRRRLEGAMSGSPDERRRFLEVVVEAPEGAPPGSPAHLGHRDANTCALLGEDRLCSAQQRYGEAVLPAVCSLFPRTLGLRGRRLEVTASLSCPEVARLCLLADDSLDLVPLDGAAAAPRPHYRWRAPGGPDGPPGGAYEGQFDVVREAVLGLLARPGHPLSSRLFFVWSFARQTRPFFHRHQGGPEGPSDAEARLAEAIAGVGEARQLDAQLDAQLEAWHQAHAALELPPKLTFDATLLLRERLEGAYTAGVHLERLTEEAFGECFDELQAARGGTDDEELSLSAPELQAIYLARRDRWSRGADGEHIEACFTRYCRHHWLRSWYTHSPDLVVHTHKLLLRLAALRFLFFCSPRLAAAEAEPEGPARRLAVERAVVDVFYRFTRGIEHGAGFLEFLGRRAGEPDMEEMAPLLARL